MEIPENYYFDPAEHNWHKVHWWHLIMLIGAFVGIIGLLFFSEIKRTVAPTQSIAIQPTKEQEKVEPEPPAPPPVPEIDGPLVSAVLNDWVSTHPGAYGMTISKVDGTVLAESGAQTQFFSASIYKLYLAYVEYQNIDAGIHSLSDPFVGSYTRGVCLDLMIRLSDNTCGEALLAEMNHAVANQKLSSYGVSNSVFSFLTTSHDAAIILSRLYQGLDLSSTSRNAFMVSMRDQKYREAFPSGFKHGTVYDKVGIRGSVEYHDTAIIEFEDGRKLIVSALTSNVGTEALAAFATHLETVLGFTQ